MAGLNINYYEGREVKGQIRWGNAGSAKDGAGGDSIFPSDIAMIVKNALNYSSADSHTEEETPYFIEEENKELFFSYVMQICHLIKWFGNYVEEHSDIEKNKSMKKYINSQSETVKEKKSEPIKLSKGDIIGKTFLIQKNNGVSVCGSYKLSDELQNRTGAVTIEDVIDNDGADKDLYSYITSVRIKSQKR